LLVAVAIIALLVASLLLSLKVNSGDPRANLYFVGNGWK